MDTRRKRRPFQVDLLLTPEDRAEYEKFLSDPRNTLEKAYQWLNGRGYALSWGAVHRHRRKWLDQLEDVRRWAMVARQFADAARAEGPGVFADATLTRFEQMMMEALQRMQQLEAGNTKGWVELAGALSKVVSSRAALEAFRADARRRAREAAAEVERQTARAGLSDGIALTNRVREILGIPPPPGEQHRALPAPPAG